MPLYIAIYQFIITRILHKVEILSGVTEPLLTDSLTSFDDKMLYSESDAPQIR